MVSRKKNSPKVVKVAKVVSIQDQGNLRVLIIRHMSQNRMKIHKRVGIINRVELISFFDFHAKETFLFRY